MSQDFSMGPYLAGAMICEHVLEENDGVKSAIRIIDRVTRTAIGPDAPSVMQPFEHRFTLFVRFKRGWAPGPYELKISSIKPSGDGPSPLQQTIFFEGDEDRGVDVVIKAKMTFDTPGIYWFDVALNDVRMTRIPFRVVYLTQKHV